MMKTQMGALLIAAVGFFSANAAVNVTSTVQSAADGGYAASSAAQTGSVLFNFDTAGALSGTSNGFTFSNNNGWFIVPLTDKANVVSGNTLNTSAPAGDTTNYLAVLNGGQETIVNSVQSYNTLALYWGSPDSFNTVRLLDQGGNSIASLAATDVIGLSTLSSSSALVTLTSSQAFYGVSFSSGGNAFELDNVRFSNASASASAVPEPASWAMMIFGFGAVGYAMRRRAKPAQGHAAH